jgi:hypothetical protein
MNGMGNDLVLHHFIVRGEFGRKGSYPTSSIGGDAALQ